MDYGVSFSYHLSVSYSKVLLSWSVIAPIGDLNQLVPKSVSVHVVHILDIADFLCVHLVYHAHFYSRC